MKLKRIFAKSPKRNESVIRLRIIINNAYRCLETSLASLEFHVHSSVDYVLGILIMSLLFSKSGADVRNVRK